jgi:hypothetical protein
MRRPAPPRDEAARHAPSESEPNVEADFTGGSTLDVQNPDVTARRAYERFQQRGGEHGRDQEDWYAAEEELKRGRSNG